MVGVPYIQKTKHDGIVYRANEQRFGSVRKEGGGGKEGGRLTACEQKVAASDA